MVKKATRESYGEALVEFADQYPQMVVLDADLSAATKSDKFAKAYPDRFINVGIAEGNMVGIAAGLATCGKIPFASTFAMFAAGRAYEQIRNSVGYPHLNVRIVGSHAGITVGEDGASHQCCEDIALMRSIPGVTIVCPSDHYEMKAAVKAALDYNGPMYIRMCRFATQSINHNDDYSFELGKGVVKREGTDVVIIATGLMVGEALKAAQELAGKGISARVINIHTIKPIDEEIVLKAAREIGRIITIEEHNILGGLGEAVCGVVCEKHPVPVHRIGVPDTFGHSGSAASMLDEYGLSGEKLAPRIEAILKG